MKTINNSVGKPNYSQRLNPDDPTTPWNETLETCNVTSGITALITAGYTEKELSKGLADRLPMDLLMFMRKNPKCLGMYEWVDPKKTSPMNEWMDILAVAIDEYLGGQKGVRVLYAADVGVIAKYIEQGWGIIIHGEYEFVRANGTTVKSGHYQSLAGMVFDDAGKQVSWIVDDPFGDPHTNYASKVGNDIVLSMQEVRDLVKPKGLISQKDVILIPKR